MSICVRISGPDPRGTKSLSRPFTNYTDTKGKDNGDVTFSSSGILLPSGLILTTATLLAPFLDPNVSEARLIYGASIQIYHESFDLETGHDRDGWKDVELVNVKEIVDVKKRLSLLLGGPSELSNRWKIGWMVAGQKDSILMERTKSLWGSVVFLGTKDRKPFGEDVLPLDSAFEGSNHVERGDWITVMGSPFGVSSPSVLMNSAVSGIISNIIGPNDDTIGKNRSNSPKGDDKLKLWLTDARCYPGMEGGPVLNRNNRIIGMLLPPLRRMDGYPVEFHLAVSINPILEMIDLTSALLKVESIRTPPKYLAAQDSVVLLRLNGSWASGVISSPGYVITNAHFIQPHLSLSSKLNGIVVDVRTSKKEGDKLVYHHFQAVPVWICNTHLDLALLRCNAVAFQNEYKPPIISYLPQMGQKIYIIGYPIYEPGPLSSRGNEELGPTWTSGIVQKIVRYGGNPVIIQTSAAVHRGNSGGILVNEDGEMLGLITCNTKVDPTKHSEGIKKEEEEEAWVEIRKRKELILTRLNFSIPSSELASLFSESFREISKAKEPEFSHWMSQKMEEKNKAKQNLWVFREADYVDNEILDPPSFSSKL